MEGWSEYFFGERNSLVCTFASDATRSAQRELGRGGDKYHYCTSASLIDKRWTMPLDVAFS